MDYIKAIEQRTSRRSYLDTPIDQNKLHQLNSFIDKYNKEADLSITLVLDGSQVFNSLRKSYGMFKNVHTLFVLKGKKEDQHLKEKLGQYGELIVLEATKMGLGTCWVAGTFDRGNSVLEVGEQEELTCVIPVGNIANEQTFKEKLVHSISHRKTKSLEEFYISDDAVPPWFITGIQAVQRAPSAMNIQPVKFEYINGDITAFVTDTRFLTELGIAKTHFSLAAGGIFDLGNHGKYHNPELTKILITELKN